MGEGSEVHVVGGFSRVYTWRRVCGSYCDAVSEVHVVGWVL